VQQIFGVAGWHSSNSCNSCDAPSTFTAVAASHLADTRTSEQSAAPAAPPAGVPIPQSATAPIRLSNRPNPFNAPNPSPQPPQSAPATPPIRRQAAVQGLQGRHRRAPAGGPAGGV
jgi:hypothetical protein